MNKIIINKIIELMKSHGISLEDIATAMQESKTPTVNEHRFDLLVEENGKQLRLPYAQGCRNNVVGIFPYSWSEVYLETSEHEETSRIGVDEDNVPVVNLWKAMHPILDALNSELKSLNLPVVEGNYFARTPYRSDLNWIAKFGKEGVDADFYPDTTKAKIRYIGMYVAED